ncbi:hypothetical protein Bca52824_010679 [Brassica carinata]|uniref:Reverse transcriptase zinc-binding domain-containing protein n=1 Tax=Brassica carinata TaxID=52824 RepID=A0A8X7WDU5_BRACI|nr:hypothetical protein Bca52824_010679 [Brassica carinata]
MIDKVKELQFVLEINVTDGVLWKKGSMSMEEISLIRTRCPTVPWDKLVWFAHGVPRYAFITWLAVSDRLSTGSKMRAWGQVQGCLLCGEPDETRDHLFFACPYTYTLWLQVIDSLLRPAPTPDWNEIIERILW